MQKTARPKRRYFYEITLPDGRKLKAMNVRSARRKSKAHGVKNFRRIRTKVTSNLGFSVRSVVLHAIDIPFYRVVMDQLTPDLDEYLRGLFKDV